jgi:hypothetical protein
MAVVTRNVIAIVAAIDAAQPGALLCVDLDD